MAAQPLAPPEAVPLARCRRRHAQRDAVPAVGAPRRRRRRLRHRRAGALHRRQRGASLHGRSSSSATSASSRPACSSSRSDATPRRRCSSPPSRPRAAAKDGVDPILVVTPADHAIARGADFTAAIRAAVRTAALGGIVVLGIRPERPDTGYGYIRAGTLEGPTEESWPVAAFVEKPDLATAQRYVADGSYYWNGGIFVLRASVWLDALRRFRPDIADGERGRFRQREDRRRVPALRHRGVRGDPGRQHRLRRDGAGEQERIGHPDPHGPARRRLERPRRLGRGLAGRRPRRRRQRRAWRRAPAQFAQHARARDQPAGRRDRAGRRHRRRDAGRRARRAPLEERRGQGPRRLAGADRDAARRARIAASIAPGAGTRASTRGRASRSSASSSSRAPASACRCITTAPSTGSSSPAPPK